MLLSIVVNYLYVRGLNLCVRVFIDSLCNETLTVLKSEEKQFSKTHGEKLNSVCASAKKKRHLLNVLNGRKVLCQVLKAAQLAKLFEQLDKPDEMRRFHSEAVCLFLLAGLSFV